jgi:ATP-binding cassette subfamily B protein
MPSPPPEVGLPPLLQGRRRRWLLALMANGLARALLAAGGMVLLRLTLAGPDAAFPASALVGALAAGLVAGAWLQHRESLDAESLAQHYIAHVRLRLFDRLATLTPTQAQRRSRGGVLMRFVGDVQALRGWVGRGIARGVVALTTLVLLWLLLLATAPLLAGVVLAVLGLGGLVLARLWGPLFDATARARQRQALVAAYMQDRIAGLAALQAAGQAGRERERLRRLNLRLRRALQQRADWRGRHRAVAALTGGGLLVALAMVGSVPVDTARLASQLGGILGTALVVVLMLPAVRTLAQAADAWVAARVARARVAEFLGAVDDHRLTVPNAHGAAQGGDLPTDPGPQPALVLDHPAWTGRVRGPAADIPHGRRVALCGASGAGKSSLLQLLGGQQRPDDGAVWLDGMRLHAMPASWLRQHVALLSPDLPLLRGSLLDNVCYQAHAPSRRALDAALTLSGLRQILDTLPQGLETRVRDGGLNLSHGLRRAVQLARCLAARPALLLIDDPGACLPGAVEDRLAALLDGFAGTVIFATHDPALAVMADEIWTFEAGVRTSAWPVHHSASPALRLHLAPQGPPA